MKIFGEVVNPGVAGLAPFDEIISLELNLSTDTLGVGDALASAITESQNVWLDGRNDAHKTRGGI